METPNVISEMKYSPLFKSILLPNLSYVYFPLAPFIAYFGDLVPVLQVREDKRNAPSALDGARGSAQPSVCVGLHHNAWGPRGQKS